MTGQPYISSAKKLATLILAIVYFGFTQAIEQADRLRLIMRAREDFAEGVVRDQIMLCTPFQEWQNDPRNASASVPTIEDWLVTNLPTDYLKQVPWATGINISVVKLRTGRVGRAANQNIIFDVGVQEKQGSREWKERIALKGSGALIGILETNQMQKLAVDTGFSVTKDEEFSDLYRRFEDDLFSKEVKFPNSEFSLSTTHVVWV